MYVLKFGFLMLGQKIVLYNFLKMLAWYNRLAKMGPLAQSFCCQ